MFWKIFLIIAYGLLAFISADILGCKFNGGRLVAPTTGGGKAVRLRNFTSKHTWWIFLKALIIGVVVGLAHYLPRATEAPVWGMIFFAVMIALLVIVTIWFLRNAKGISEFFWYAILATAIILAAQAAVHVMALWWDSRVLSWIFFVVPWMLFALVIGFAAVIMALRLVAITHLVVWRVVAVVMAVLATVSLVVISVNGDRIAGLPSDGGKKTANSNKSSSVGATTTGTDFWCRFYNDDVQKDGDEANDFNFGLNPYQKGMSAKELAGVHKSVMLTDPANGTAAMCWLDKHVGTRYMGDQFYDEYDADDKAINAAKERYVENEKLYKNTMTVFLAYLEKATIEVREVQGTLEDQMYQIPSRMSYRGIPDVAVFKSGEQGGHYLVYIFTIKGRVVEVPFRVECLFQPTNVTEYLKVTVSEKPDPTPGTPSDGPVPTGTGSDPPSTTSPTPTPTTPTPTPTNPYNKDPSKSDNSGKNDDPGPGKNTNNGEGANYSTEDNDSNSNHTTWEEYQKAIGELENINNNQKTGKDDSTPSYNGGGTVDNNGAAANTPSPDKPKESAISGDSNGQEWDGPDI